MWDRRRAGAYTLLCVWHRLRVVDAQICSGKGGYTPNYPEMKCRRGKFFSPSTYICEPDACPLPNVRNRLESGCSGLPHPAVVNSGSSCSTQCSPGYTPSVANLKCFAGKLTPVSQQLIESFDILWCFLIPNSSNISIKYHKMSWYFTVFPTISHFDHVLCWHDLVAVCFFGRVSLHVAFWVGVGSIDVPVQLRSKGQCNLAMQALVRPNTEWYRMISDAKMYSILDCFAIYSNAIICYVTACYASRFAVMRQVS